MKLKQLMFSMLFFLGLGLTLVSCKDQAAKDAEAKMKVEAVLPTGVNVDVKEGVATLSGMFPDESSQATTDSAVRKVAGIKSVVNNASVTPPPAPVEISPDAALTTAVNSALAMYSGVSAEVMDGVVTLNGTISKAELPTLMQAINALHPKKVDNKLVVK